MLRQNWVRLILMLIIVTHASACDMSRWSLHSSRSDNERFMEMWSTYTHCSQSENLDAMRMDALRLRRSVHAIDERSVSDPVLLEGHEPFHREPADRLSADPVAMAAACALRTGQAAQATGRHDVAREMFHMVMTSAPPERYQYYMTQARLALKRLDAAGHTAPSIHARPGGTT